MATVSITFDLDTEEEGYENALNGGKYKWAIQDMYEAVKSIEKSARSKSDVQFCDRMRKIMDDACDGLKIFE